MTNGVVSGVVLTLNGVLRGGFGGFGGMRFKGLNQFSPVCVDDVDGGFHTFLRVLAFCVQQGQDAHNIVLLVEDGHVDDGAAAQLLDESGV